MMDDTDRQIIELLQGNAQLSNAVLAEHVGLTASTVYERVKKLERKGIIKRYVALVDPGLLGKPITAFIRLAVGSLTESYLEAKNRIIEICETEPDIIECHGVAGEDCYVLKVRVASPKQLEELIERIRCHTNVTRSTTSIVLSTYKETTWIKP